MLLIEGGVEDVLTLLAQADRPRSRPERVNDNRVGSGGQAVASFGQGEEQIGIFPPWGGEPLVEPTDSLQRRSTIETVGSGELGLFKTGHVALEVGRGLRQGDDDSSR